MSQLLIDRRIDENELSCLERLSNEHLQQSPQRILVSRILEKKVMKPSLSIWWIVFVAPSLGCAATSSDGSVTTRDPVVAVCGRPAAALEPSGAARAPTAATPENTPAVSVPAGYIPAWEMRPPTHTAVASAPPAGQPDPASQRPEADNPGGVEGDRGHRLPPPIVSVPGSTDEPSI